MWVADVNIPPVLPRFRPRLEPGDCAAGGLSAEGLVRNANASFSFLKGIVISAPDSSPSLTAVTLLPGYCFCSWALAEAMSDGVNPLTDVPFDPFISDLGNRNLRPTATEPSGLNVALAS